MKKAISLSTIFRLIAAGVIMTSLILCGGIFFLTKDLTAVTICLITAGTISVWLFILVGVLQKQLARFTGDICRTIDRMMQGESVPRTLLDEDTMSDRISHQLNRLYQMMQSNNRIIAEQRADLQGMISDISHQVKTPVTNLKMAAATLLEQRLPRFRQREYLQSMNIQLDKLDFLMSAMVKSSRLETGVITLKKQQASVYETLAVALGGVFLKAEEKHMQVTVDCPADLLVPHDSKWTAEALYNLLENAVKYTPAGGTITVKAVPWEACIKIDISDTGRGIPESSHAAIFKRFYREPEVHDIEGIGIGLYLTREIITKQNGRIKVTSAIGAGTTFTVFLPKD